MAHSSGQPPRQRGRCAGCAGRLLRRPARIGADRAARIAPVRRPQPPSSRSISRRSLTLQGLPPCRLPHDAIVNAKNAKLRATAAMTQVCLTSSPSLHLDRRTTPAWISGRHSAWADSAASPVSERKRRHPRHAGADSAPGRLPEKPAARIGTDLGSDAPARSRARGRGRRRQQLLRGG